MAVAVTRACMQARVKLLFTWAMQVGMACMVACIYVATYIASAGQETLIYVAIHEKVKFEALPVHVCMAIPYMYGIAHMCMGTSLYILIRI